MSVLHPRYQEGRLALLILVSCLLHLALITILFGSGRGGGRGGSSGGSSRPGLISVARIWEAGNSGSSSQSLSPSLTHQSEEALLPQPREKAIKKISEPRPEPAREAALERSATPRPELGGAEGRSKGDGTGSGAESESGFPFNLGGADRSQSGWGLPAEDEFIVEPSCAVCPKPKYSALAKRRGLQGAVWLQIEVLPDGNPGDVFVSQSSGFSELDQLALRTVKQEWKFFPGRRGGRPATRRAEVKIKFQLEEAD